MVFKETQREKEVTNRRNKRLDEFATFHRKLSTEEDYSRGVLAVRVIQFQSIGKGQEIIKSMFCEIEVQQHIQQTTYLNPNSGIVSWDQAKHFSVNIIGNEKHVYNLVEIRILTAAPNERKDQTAIQEYGRMTFHLHEIISNSPVRSTFDVWQGNQLVGEMLLEFTFNYGALGYGYSQQLQDDKHTPLDKIAHSLFPRVNPPLDMMDTESGTLAVHTIPHPRYIPFTKKAILSYAKELGLEEQDVPFEYSNEEFQRSMDAIQEFREMYVSIPDRRARLGMLQQRLQKHNRPPSAVPMDGSNVVLEERPSKRNFMNYVQSIRSFLEENSQELIGTVPKRRMTLGVQNKRRVYPEAIVMASQPVEKDEV